MLALQSSPPALGPPLVGTVVLAVAGAALGAMGSAVVRRLSNPVGKYPLFYGIVLLPFAVVSYVVLGALGLGPAVVAPLFGTQSGPLVTAAAAFVETVAAGVVAVAAYAPTVRGVRTVRDIDLTTRRAVAQMLRYVVGVSVLLTVFFTAFRHGDSVLVLVAGLAAFVVVLYFGAPWYVPLLRSTRRPDDETGDRLERLRSRAGLDVRDTRILETGDAETANAIVRGPPGYRRLFVSDAFRDAFDDDTATALLAVQAGRVDANVLTRLLGTVVAMAVLLLLSLDGPMLPLLAGAVGTLLCGLWFTRRGVDAADEYAAERVGNETLAVALERYASFHSLEPSRRRIPNPLSKSPTLGDRIDRLREDTEG
ncbi:peptidase [Halomicroarcula sp. S1AR25-4]|uniref:peptidase n=1 Tax=Haloarcula sp. S1AR25-4 TaxID=2950538 RepID=UPI00287676F3|nr:peptidase [Halomicroarcula sp. S1AR25-4]MDS0279482.1 peptidase [Halomicroarcula sp. S1AR25-4]